MSVERKMAELVIEEYAKKKGLPAEEIKKRYLPILIGEEKEGKYDEVASKLLKIAEVLSSIKDLSKDADPATKNILSGLGTALVTNTLSGSDDVSEYIKPIIRTVTLVKAIEAATSGGDNEQLKILQEELKGLRDELEKYRRKEEREEFAKMMDEKLRERDETIKQLYETVNYLLDEVKKFREGGKPKEEDEETLLKKVETVKEKSMRLLKDLGYEVKPTTLTREEVEELIKKEVTNLPPDELKKILEKHGYRVVGGPIPYDEAMKMVEEARKKAYEEALEDKRIEATKDIIKDSVRQIVQLFAPAIQTLFRHIPEEGEEASEEQGGEE